jgi:uncharacterized protein (DUF433 family)
MSPQIIDRGRGAEIAATRLTVYDILDYVQMRWGHARIALWFRISSDEVLAAIRYSEEHRDEVMADDQRILDRNAAARNPPEVEEKLKGARARLEALRKELQERKGDRVSV